MENFPPALSNCRLFADIPAADLAALLDCLAGIRKLFNKNSFIFKAGEKAESVGLTLSGAVHVLKENYWGHRLLLARIEPGGIFGEAFAGSGEGLLPVSVLAAEDSEILLLDCRRVLTTCSPSCSFHATIIKNLALILAERNVHLTRRLEHVTQPTTREKILSYLSERARLAGGDSFDIPFSRQELADYLAVDRSALSSVLSKMRAEKLLRCRRNHFELLQGTPGKNAG